MAPPTANSTTASKRRDRSVASSLAVTPAGIQSLNAVNASARACSGKLPSHTTAWSVHVTSSRASCIASVTSCGCDLERWSASSAHADMSATAACALGPHGGVALGSGVFGHPPLESGAAIAVAFWTREKSVSAPPAVATAADICARWGPNSPLPSGVPSIARSSAVMDAASGGVIANPSACALARSIAAPMIRTRGARTSPGVSAGAASKSRAILQPSGPSFTALRCASAAASVAGSPGERSARAAVIAAATAGSAIVQPSGRARVPRARGVCAEVDCSLCFL